MKQLVQSKKARFKARLALILMTLFFTVTGFAQERTVTGVITDESNTPLPGVNVIIKGTSTGTVSDIDGKFSIKVPGNETTLSISYVGYEKQEIQVGTQTTINVVLKEETTQLNDVVVIGYGVQKKKLVTGATVQVSNKELEKNHVTRLESALQGITPGMVIVKQNGQPGSDYNISIRGLSSPNNNSPLVLVDGVPGSLSSLNPEDIESVDVLKDAASAAIYGSRGGNGVVLITTKKGKSGEAVVSFDMYYGVSNLAKKVDVLNGKQYATIMNEAQRNSVIVRKPLFDPAKIDSLGKGTDWLDVITNKNAPSRNYHLGVTGGTDKSNYAMALSYTSEEGILDWEKKSKYERLGIMLNSENKVKSYLKVGENLSYSRRVSKALGNGDMYSNFLYDVLTADPNIPLYGPNNYGNEYGVSKLDKKLVNPVANMHYNFNGINKYDDIIGDIYAELQIAKGLKFRTDFGANLNIRTYQDHTDTFKIGFLTSSYRTIPDYKQEMYRTFSYNYDNVLTYEKTIDKHSFLLMAGTNAQDNWFYNVISELQGFQSNKEPVLSNVTTRDSVVKIDGDFGKADSRYSYFGRLSYNYDEKYLLTASIRRDASSRFGSSKRVGVFPAASLGWVISKEDIMQTMSGWLDFLKIRGSWGQNGNEPTEKFAYMATVTSLSRYYTFGGTRTTGTSPNVMANPLLQWEASEQLNIGFDSRFLKSFYLNFDWYNKTSDNWIVPHPVPATTGREGISSTLPFVNGGKVINKGVEFEIGYNKTFGDLSIDVKANMSYNKNKVTQVLDSLIQGSKDVLYNGSEELYRVQEGYPLGYFWGYKTNGILQNAADSAEYSAQTGINARPGDVRFVDLNHDHKIDQLDKTQIGDPNPHYIYGFNLGASFKGIDFSVNLQGVSGNSIIQSYRSLDAQLSNYTTDILNRWTGPGTSNRLPRVTQNAEANRNWRNFSDISVQDGSFLRIKTVNLGFDLKKLFFKKLPVQQLRIYVSGINLYTFTKYTGFDPEIGYGSHYDKNNKLIDPYASGIDLGNYPSARTYLLGLNLKF